jgi:N-methylhydantoinase B
MCGLAARKEMNMERALINRCDSVTVEIVAGAIKALVSEVSALIERTAMSPFVREKKDYHVGVYDRTGRLLHSSSTPVSARGVDPVLSVFPAETMREGDVYWYNDAYQSKGAVSHTPDQSFTRPVFKDGKLIGFLESFAHFNDIGGLRPGTLSPACTSIFHEGTLVPPVCLEREGVVHEDLLRIFVRNSRFPDMVRGDIRSLAAATRLGARRYRELFERFATPVVEDAFRQLEARTKAEVREAVLDVVSDGEYEFTEVLDSDGHGNGPFKINFRMSVRDRRFYLDTTGTSDQCVGPFNFTMPMEAPSAILTRILLPDNPRRLNNLGMTSIFDEVKVRDGSLLSPRFPAALGLRMMTMGRVQSVIVGLLAKATEGQINASSSSFVIVYLRGETEDGNTFLLSDSLGVGRGGSPTFDGNDGIYEAHNQNYPAEFVDSGYPIRVLRYALAQDSGGAGRWRGGCGIIRDLQVLAPETVLGIRMDSIDFPPWGISGGKSGGRGRCIVNPDTPDEREINAISDGIILKKNDIVRVITGGGGGWGHPHDREPERVLSDVLGGFVSLEFAREEYGVAIDADTLSIDQAETARLRSDRYPTKLFHRGEYIEAL